MLASRKNSYEIENPDTKEISIEEIEKNSTPLTATKRIEHYISAGLKTENRNRIDYVKTFIHTAALNNNNATHEYKL